MAVNSKAKGKRFELAIASHFREAGFQNARRSAQFCGNNENGVGDVVGVDEIHIECKNQQKMRLYEWMEQAVRDASAEGKGRIPVVFHKQNNKEVLVTMREDDFFKIFREYVNGYIQSDTNGVLE